jgi:hypothetical protein
MACDERTVRRDIQALRKLGIHVPTRGFLHDIGPTLSHKAQAIRHWLDGKEPVAITRAINHSLRAVERYLEDFKRVAFLVMKGLESVAISRAVHLSPALVATYEAMYQVAASDPAYAYRFDELRHMTATEPTATADETSSGKKGVL